MLKTHLTKLPKIGAPVRAKVSLFRSPEGSIGHVQSFLIQDDSLVVIVESLHGHEVPVRMRDYPYFFEELPGGAPDDATQSDQHDF